MNNYVTTNIRISEGDYLKLKAEAARERKSLSSVIREKIAVKKENRSQSEITRLYQRRQKIAEKFKKKLKDFDIVKSLREMRYEGKW